MTRHDGAVLTVRDLAVDYRGRGGVTRAVHAASLEIARGEILALVGESGSGKTSTAHAVIGLLGAGSIASGDIVLSGERIDGLPERRLRTFRGRRIGLVPQDPTVSLNPVLRVGAQISDVARIHGRVARAGASALAIEMLERVGIDAPQRVARQYPHELSGGMRQRVLIAMALVCEPELLIADEPTSALDVTVQRRILDLLTGLTRSAGTAVLFITHDLAVASDRADRIAVMRAGRIVEQGAATDIVSRPREDYTRALLAAAPSMSQAVVRTPVVRPADDRGDESLVVVRGLSRRFGQGADSVLAVEDVSFDIPEGSTFALVGESGSGKTTTARIVARLESATAGEVRFGGVDISGATGSRLRALRRELQMVYQSPFASLDPRRSVASTIAEPLRAFRIGSRAERERTVVELLDAVGLSAAIGSRRPRELSGGQRQRVAIARAIALNPRLLVLDEPVSALDVSVQAQVLQLLQDLQRERGLTYLMISHDLAVVRQISDRVAVMRAGRIVETGETDRIFSAPGEEYTKSLLAAIPGSRRRDAGDR